MRKPVVIGNWKLNGTVTQAKTLITEVKAGAEQLPGVDVAVCPPHVYLPLAVELTAGSPLGVGAQNAADQTDGAFTGEVSSAMLADVGAQYCILGHSERRALYHETDAMIAEKVKLALDAGITPVLCVGETLEQREADQTNDVVATQVQAVMDHVGAKAFAKLIIAYEPVWAIGTGKTATPEQAQDVHAFIRGLVAKADAEVADGLRIQYGGSMKPANAAELLAQPDIDGGLIGGASLKSEDFLAICQAAAERGE